MNDFAILTNRKRAIIALVHSIVFLGIAAAGFASRKNGILHGNAPQGDFILVMIYLTVTSILAWLAGISRGARERVYFALCACSATFGLLRTSFGDSALPHRPIHARRHADLGCIARFVDRSFLLAAGQPKPRSPTKNLQRHYSP